MVVLSPADMIKVGQNVSQTKQAIQTVPTLLNNQATQQNEGMLGDLDGLLKLADKVNDIIGKISQIRGQVAPPVSESMPPVSPYVVNNPIPPAETPQIENKPPMETPQETKEVSQMKEKKLDTQKIKDLVADLLINQAKKMPKSYQDAKLGDITGDNFRTFNWNFGGIPISSDVIVGQIAEQLKKAIPNLYKED